MKFQLKKVKCTFCTSELSYAGGHLKKFIRHMKFEHGAMFNAKYLMAACFMNSDEKEAVTEIVFKKNNLDIENSIIDEVTLEGGVPKQTTIEINFNTGEIKKEVICEKSYDVIENKRVRVNPPDDNRAEVNTVFDNEMTNNITECRKATKLMKPLVDKKEEIYKILEDSDDEDNSSNHSEKLSKTNKIETEEAVMSLNIHTIPGPGEQSLLETEQSYNVKTIETGKQFHSSDKKKTVEVSNGEKVHSFVLPLQYEQFRTDVSENGRIHNKNNEPSSPSLIKPKRQFKCDQCPVSYSWKNSLIPHKKKKHGNVPKFSGRRSSSFKSSLPVKSEFEEKQIKEENSGNSVIHACELCGDKFQTESDLSFHKEMHVSADNGSEVSDNQDVSLENREGDEQFIVNTDNEGGVFVVIGVDTSSAYKEGDHVEADPFLSSVREKLKDNIYEKDALLEEHETDDNIATVEELETSDVFTAVNVALENEFLIL